MILKLIKRLFSEMAENAHLWFDDDGYYPGFYSDSSAKDETSNTETVNEKVRT